jgi:6-pyruvoyltetrahydropterin/6-carboxytetrahydropterin synthase
MHEISVETVFSAAHAIVIRGEREPLHGHDWRVTVRFAGPELDADGLLVDFHAVEAALEAVVGPWRSGNLNEQPPFVDGLNPTAEHVAMTIAGQLSSRLAGELAAGARLVSATVTEAPGCAATHVLG